MLMVAMYAVMKAAVRASMLGLTLVAMKAV